MAEIILLICLVVFVKMMKQEGVFDQKRSPATQRFLVPAKGILAWSVVIFLLWGIWQIYLIIDPIIQAPFSLSSVYSFGELMLILSGVGFAYQSLVTLSEDKDLRSMLSVFLRLLRFQPVMKKLVVDKTAEPIDLHKYIEEQEVKEKKEPESDFETHWGSER